MGVVNRFLLMRQVASPARTKATLLGEAVLLTKDRVPLESVIPEGSSEEPPPWSLQTGVGTHKLPAGADPTLWEGQSTDRTTRLRWRTDGI